MNLSIFSERLSYLIFEAGINGQQLSIELGCGDSTIYRYLGEVYVPTLEMLVKIANYFNCTTDYLLGLDTENHPQTFRECPVFSEWFPEVLKKYNVTRYRICKLTGIAESVMRYWVQGVTKPGVENLLKVANAIGCSFDYLIGRTES